MAKRKACMMFRPLIRGTGRQWIAKRGGITYHVTREFTGEWTTAATIGRQTRNVSGSGQPTRAKAIRVACEHATFHSKYFR